MVRVARNERERRSVSNVAARRVYFRIPLEYLHPLSFLDLREFHDLSKRGEKEKGVSPFFLSFRRSFRELVRLAGKGKRRLDEDRLTFSDLWMRLIEGGEKMDRYLPHSRPINNRIMEEG